jgi:peptidoglycan hydrolase CwlO-like protein
MPKNHQSSSHPLLDQYNKNTRGIQNCQMQIDEATQRMQALQEKNAQLKAEIEKIFTIVTADEPRGTVVADSSDPTSCLRLK